ncbi:hypothetical protein T492DRAFT_970305 [Pavlovales sp. CCMP2436]|nr:hypothetical protein T492DRAFT_970305 [Pavlovales sp. CCMP2436]
MSPPSTRIIALLSRTLALLALLAGCSIAEVSARAAQRAALLPVGIWAGNYSCGGTSAWLLLHVEDSSPLQAVFHFVYPRSGTHGAFTVREPVGGGDSDGPRSFVLDSGEWVREVAHTEMVGLAGRLSDDGMRLEGRILHDGCDGFALVRATIDLAPPGARAAPAGRARHLVHHTFDLLHEQLVRAGLGGDEPEDDDDDDDAARSMLDRLFASASASSSEEVEEVPPSAPPRVPTPEARRKIRLNIRMASKPESTTVNMYANASFGKLIAKLAEKLGGDPRSARLTFNGDVITAQQTPESLDLDDEDVLDFVMQ